MKLGKFAKFSLIFWANCGILLILSNPIRWLFFGFINILFLKFVSPKKLILFSGLVAPAVYSFHVLAIENNRLEPLINSGTLVRAEGRMASDPSKMPAKKINNFQLPTRYTALVNLDQITFNGISYKIRLPIRLISSQFISLQFGQVAEFVGKIQSTNENKVVAILATRTSPNLIKDADLITKLANKLRENFLAACKQIKGDSGALIPGFVMGDTSLESDKFKSEMQIVGLTHLTAVSGENFSILALALAWIFERLIRNYKFRIILVALISLWFIYLARPSGSVMRAAVMCGFYLWGKWKGLEIEPVNALTGSLFILILFDPFFAVDPGFVLSFLVTLGIFLLYPSIFERISKRLGENRFTKVLALSLSATIPTIPIAIWISGQISITSLLANLLVELAVAPITVLGLLAAIFSPFFKSFTHLILLPTNLFAQWIVLVAKYLSVLPPIPFPKGGLGAILFLGLGMIGAVFFRLWHSRW